MKGIKSLACKVIATAAFLLPTSANSQISEAPVEFTSAEHSIILNLSIGAGIGSNSKIPASPSNVYADNINAKKLGKALFFDPRLSRNNAISCATCHQPEHAFSDGLTVAQGMGLGQRNSPTLVNMAWGKWFFWDGGADSLWAQAIGPLSSRAEMGGDWPGIYTLFISDQKLLRSYNAVFPQYALHPNIEFSQLDLKRFQANIGKALAAFQRDIQQFNSPFDHYVQQLHQNTRKQPVLSPAELAGIKLFIGKARCITCHSGPNFTDGQFHNIRLISQVKNPKDNGRYGAIAKLKSSAFSEHGVYSDLTKKEKDSHPKNTFLKQSNDNWAAYKTPTLRNIADTKPYMHDGSIATLEAVIEHYSTFNEAAPAKHSGGLLVPLNLTPLEKQQLVAFLKSLSGTVEIPTYE